MPFVVLHFKIKLFYLAELQIIQPHTAHVNEKMDKVTSHVFKVSETEAMGADIHVSVRKVLEVVPSDTLVCV